LDAWVGKDQGTGLPSSGTGDDLSQPYRREVDFEDSSFSSERIASTTDLNGIMALVGVSAAGKNTRPWPAS